MGEMKMPNSKNLIGGYQERECKLDAPDDATLARVQQWVSTNHDIFTPATDGRFLKDIPDVMHGLFRIPSETTEVRMRIYWDTEGLDGAANGIEIRQELQAKGGIKQMVKEGGNATASDPLLDRTEYPARLKKFGPDLDAIEDDEARKRIKKIFKDKELKPLVCMISQRTRIKYHPKGNPDIEIELGFDYPCWGFTFDGFNWKGPQLELEMVKGPACHQQATLVLQHEAGRFEECFSLVRNINSKPTPGFDHLAVFLKTETGQAAARMLKSKKAWWADMKRGFRMIDVAPRLKARY